ncbi:unnamed protein product [Adineta steineri]|uniref:Uncharacterized protein n=1 Tax=Adineta steineri TaxID=433720 RepID=A0A815QWC7_9BILA|nr:unnamed protein product [Adineta steineri]CAF1468801.1 unnamed protein product [Adineta steineri]CAF1469322.1 unnamed protein product [Adineta steineri]
MPALHCVLDSSYIHRPDSDKQQPFQIMTENNTTTGKDECESSCSNSDRHRYYSFDQGSTCNKCRDWYRLGNRWNKCPDAACSGITKKDTDGHPDGGGSTRTYINGHGQATGWDITGSTSTRDYDGGRLGSGAYIVTHGTASTSKGHPDLCTCEIK